MRNKRKSMLDKMRELNDASLEGLGKVRVTVGGHECVPCEGSVIDVNPGPPRKPMTKEEAEAWYGCPIPHYGEAPDAD